MNQKFIQLANNGLAPSNDSIADHLYEQSEWLRDGSYGDVRTVVVIIETHDGDLTRNVCGSSGNDLARVTGLLLASATRGCIGDE